MSNLPVVRSRDDARLAGVCAALARAWDVDPLVTRVAFVVVTLMTNGFALVAYLAIWALLPREGEADEPVRRWLPFTRSWSSPQLAAVVAAVAAVAGGYLTGTGPGGVVIMALAWLLLRHGFSGRRGPAAPFRFADPSTPFARAATEWQRRLDNVAAGRPADWEPPVPETAPSPRQRAGRRGVRTWLGIMVALGVAWSALAAWDALGGRPDGLLWTSATLLVLGGALVHCSRANERAWGRPPLLLATTVIVAIGVVSELTPFTPTGHVPATGTVSMTPGVPTHDLPVGDQVVDLRDRRVTEDATLAVNQAVGDLTVQVPREGNVVVTSHVRVGEITAPGRSAEGLDQTVVWERVTDPAAPTLRVDASLGVGDLEVVP